MSDDHGPQNHQEQAWFDQASQNGREYFAGVQSKAMFPGQFLPLQRTLRAWGGLALQETSHRKPCPENGVEEHIEEAVVELTFERLAYGQLRASNEMKSGLSQRTRKSEFI